MVKRVCPNGHIIRDRKALKCSQCGEDLPPLERTKRKWWLGVIAVPLIAVLAIVVWLETGGMNRLTFDAAITYYRIRAPFVQVLSIGRREPTPTPRPTKRPQSLTSDVTYKVSGSTKKASVTLENASGGTEQFDISVPWSKTYFGMQQGDFVYIAAQNAQSSGSIKAEIIIDGRTYRKSESSGQYVIASCSGLIP